MNKNLSPEFWESVDSKWRFWKDLEITLTEIQPLMKEETEDTVSIMHVLIDLFKLLEPQKFKKPEGRNRSIAIISTFVMEQVNGHTEEY